MNTNRFYGGYLLQPLRLNQPCRLMQKDVYGNTVCRTTSPVTSIKRNDASWLEFDTAHSHYEVFPNKPCLNADVGKRVELIFMNDPYPGKLASGSLGTIKAIDSIGQIHVSWDCGSSLALVPEVDRFNII